MPAAVRAYPRERCGYFCAKRTIDISPDNALWSHAFATRGDGKVMGIMMYSMGYAMDGDEFTYIDGSKTPQIHGDGTEDDHNQGWGGYAMQQPYWGGVINGFQGGYRLYVNDSYLFNREIAINYEHSLCGGGRKGQKTDCIVWYYLRDPAQCNLRLTDELDVGDAASEKAHQYAVSGETWSGRTASAYDACEQGPPYPLTDDGRAFTGKSTFTVQARSRQPRRQAPPPAEPQSGQRATGQSLRGRRGDRRYALVFLRSAGAARDRLCRHGFRDSGDLHPGQVSRFPSRSSTSRPTVERPRPNSWLPPKPPP